MHSGPAPGGTLTPPSFHFFIWINKIKGQIQAFYKEIGKLRHSLSTVLLNDIFISVIIDTSKENFDPDKEESEGQSVSSHGALRPFFFFFQLPQSKEAPRRKQAATGVGEEFTPLSMNGN